MLTRILTMTARNTRCDGAQPKCANCARRSTPCVYDPDPKGKSKKISQPTFSPLRDDRYSYPSSPKQSPGQTSRSNSDVCGRGPLIPQERYTTGTISVYNAPDQHPITFNLETPDQSGIPIIDILNKTDGFVRIQDRTEVLNMGGGSFILRVLVSSLDLIGDFLCGSALNRRFSVAWVQILVQGDFCHGLEELARSHHTRETRRGGCNSHSESVRS